MSHTKAGGYDPLSRAADERYRLSQQGGRQVEVPYSSQKLWVDETKIKPPKLRFKPGMLFVYEGEIIIVVAAFRLRENDREWLYHCSVVSRNLDEFSKQQAMNHAFIYDPKAEPQRVSYWLFCWSYESLNYFSWAYTPGCSGRIITNKDLIQKGERLISEPSQL